MDAIRIQVLRDNGDPSNPSYRIDVNVEHKKLIVRDNGIGMSEADLQNFFWTIGASGKRTGEASKAGCVGMFGIGGFANFGVCDTLEVISQTGEILTALIPPSRKTISRLPVLPSLPSPSVRAMKRPHVEQSS